MLWGIHAVTEELINYSERINRSDSYQEDVFQLFVARDNTLIREIINKAEDLEIPIRKITNPELNRLSGTKAHRGVVLINSEKDFNLKKIFHNVNNGKKHGSDITRKLSETSSGKRYSDSNALNEAIKTCTKRKTSLIVVTDGITDPVNLGVIARSVEQFSVDVLIFPQRRSAQLNDLAKQMSAGAISHIEAFCVVNISRIIEKLKCFGFWIYGADTIGNSLSKVKFPDHVVLVLGSEGRGIHRLVKDQCDYLVKIPTTGQLDSLNVAVAAGILIYEVRRQQKN